MASITENAISALYNIFSKENEEEERKKEEQKRRNVEQNSTQAAPLLDLVEMQERDRQQSLPLRDALKGYPPNVSTPQGGSLLEGLPAPGMALGANQGKTQTGLLSSVQPQAQAAPQAQALQAQAVPQVPQAAPKPRAKAKPTLLGKTKPKPKPEKKESSSEVESMSETPKEASSTGTASSSLTAVQNALSGGGEGLGQNALQSMMEQFRQQQEQELENQRFLQQRLLESDVRMEDLKRQLNALPAGMPDPNIFHRMAERSKEARGYEPDYSDQYTKPRTHRDRISDLLSIEKAQRTGLGTTGRGAGAGRGMNPLQLAKFIAGRFDADREFDRKERHHDDNLIMQGRGQAIKKAGQIQSQNQFEEKQAYNWSKDNSNSFRKNAKLIDSRLGALKGLLNSLEKVDANGMVSAADVQNRASSMTKNIGDEKGNLATRDVDRMLMKTLDMMMAEWGMFFKSKDQKIPKETVVPLYKRVRQAYMEYLNASNKMYDDQINTIDIDKKHMPLRGRGEELKTLISKKKEAMNSGSTAKINLEIQQITQDAERLNLMYKGDTLSQFFYDNPYYLLNKANRGKMKRLINARKKELEEGRER